jgi:hypothetical protein
VVARVAVARMVVDRTVVSRVVVARAAGARAVVAQAVAARVAVARAAVGCRASAGVALWGRPAVERETPMMGAEGAATGEGPQGFTEASRWDW